MTNNTTLWAAWEKVYTVRFHRNDGKSYSDDEIASIQVLKNHKITEIPVSPTREGYLFVGWSLDRSLLDLENKVYWDFLTDIVQSDINLYAIWEEDKEAEITDEKEKPEVKPSVKPPAEKEEKPEEPTENNPTDNHNRPVIESKIPQTGDENTILPLYSFLAFCALVVLAIVWFRYKKAQK